MSELVLFRVSLWTVPWFSRRTEGPGRRFSPFKVQTGGLFMATDSSHWKVAGSGAVTSTSSSSFTITRAWAAAAEKKLARRKLICSVPLWLSARLTFHHQFGFGCVLSDLNAVGALILHSHLLDHQFMGAAINQDFQPIRGEELLPAFVPGSIAVRRGNGALEDHAVFLQGCSVSQGLYDGNRKFWYERKDMEDLKLLIWPRSRQVKCWDDINGLTFHLKARSRFNIPGCEVDFPGIFSFNVAHQQEVFGPCKRATAVTWHFMIFSFMYSVTLFCTLFHFSTKEDRSD